MRKNNTGPSDTLIHILKQYQHKCIKNALNLKNSIKDIYNSFYKNNKKPKTLCVYHIKSN